MSEQMDFADGKYTVINENGKLTALRYGESWGRDLTGDNLIYWMLVEAIRLKEERDALAEWKRQAEWIDKPFKAEALAGYGFAAPTPREFSKKILERHRPHVAKLQAERDALAAKLKELEGQEPVAWVDVKDSYKGPYNFNGMKLLPVGKHYLFARPAHLSPTNQMVGSWPWLRGVISGIPTRTEPIGGQMQRYVALDEVLGWIEEGHRRSAEAQQAKNAERYAYLRSQHEGSVAASFAVFAPEQPIGEFGPVGSMPGELDAAIDSAMRADSHKVEG